VKENKLHLEFPSASYNSFQTKNACIASVFEIYFKKGFILCGVEPKSHFLCVNFRVIPRGALQLTTLWSANYSYINAHAHPLKNKALSHALPNKCSFHSSLFVKFRNLAVGCYKGTRAKQGGWEGCKILANGIKSKFLKWSRADNERQAAALFFACNNSNCVIHLLIAISGLFSSSEAWLTKPSISWMGLWVHSLAAVHYSASFLANLTENSLCCIGFCECEVWTLAFVILFLSFSPSVRNDARQKQSVHTETNYPQMCSKTPSLFSFLLFVALSTVFFGRRSFYMCKAGFWLFILLVFVAWELLVFVSKQ